MKPSFLLLEFTSLSTGVYACFIIQRIYIYSLGRDGGWGAANSQRGWGEVGNMSAGEHLHLYIILTYISSFFVFRSCSHISSLFTHGSSAIVLFPSSHVRTLFSLLRE